MGDNITWSIFRRELNGVGKIDSWLVANMLEQLYCEEFMFDHPYLLRLHMFIKSLTAKNETVRRVVIERIIKWRSDPDNVASHVFLVQYFKQYLSESDLDFINMLTDEIKMNSL